MNTRARGGAIENERKKKADKFREISVSFGVFNCGEVGGRPTEVFVNCRPKVSRAGFDKASWPQLILAYL